MDIMPVCMQLKKNGMSSGTTETANGFVFAVRNTACDLKKHLKLQAVALQFYLERTSASGIIGPNSFRGCK